MSVVCYDTNMTKTNYAVSNDMYDIDALYYDDVSYHIEITLFLLILLIVNFQYQLLFMSKRVNSLSTTLKIHSYTIWLLNQKIEQKIHHRVQSSNLLLKTNLDKKVTRSKSF